MYPSTQSIHPVQSIFGSGFIPEHHVEGDLRKLPPFEREVRFAEFVKSLRGLVCGEAGNR